MNYGGIYRALIVGAGVGGRVQVSFPWMAGEDVMWASVCSPPGVRASYQEGQMVFVVFEGGDAHRPVVIGAIVPGG
jgi:hypothetical protein